MAFKGKREKETEPNGNEKSRTETGKGPNMEKNDKEGRQ